MKSYTDLSQSKKLAKILPIESVDMYYQYVLPKSDRVKHNPEIGNPISALEWYNKGYTMSGKEPITMDEYCVPCWSLAALLSLIPRPDLHQTKGGQWCCIAESNSMVFSRHFDNPVDTCVDMIYRLKEMNYEK